MLNRGQRAESMIGSGEGEADISWPAGKLTGGQGDELVDQLIGWPVGRREAGTSWPAGKLAG